LHFANCSHTYWILLTGACFGRLMGESMAVWFPNGVGGHLVVPGGYAIVGAAALSGSVTHTISTSVIVFELTGQMGHVLPCVVSASTSFVSSWFSAVTHQISVLIANMIAHKTSPSIYDSVIQLNGLPFIPDRLGPE
jgi:chloride channel 2